MYTIFNMVQVILDKNSIYKFQDIWRIFTRVYTNGQTECINTFHLLCKCWKENQIDSLRVYFNLESINGVRICLIYFLKKIIHINRRRYSFCKKFRLPEFTHFAIRWLWFDYFCKMSGVCLRVCVTKMVWRL